MSFSQLRFDHYARELSLAVYDLSLESRESPFLALKNDFRNAVQSKSSRQTMSDMSIEALKQRFMAIPGIENLTMRQEGGKQVFSLGGPFVEVNMNATEAEIETALTSIAAEPIKVTPMPLITMMGDPPPIAQPLPSPTGFVPGSISSIFKNLRARREAMVAGIQADGAELAKLIDAGEQMGAALNAEKEAIKAEFHGLTNFPT